MPAQGRLSVGTGLLLFAAGAVLGLFGGFLQALAWRPGSFPVPLGALLVLATLVAAIRTLVHVFDTRVAGFVLLAGWLAMSIVLALPWPGGDIVIGSGPVALFYLFGGVVIASAVANVPARLRPAPPAAVVAE